MEALSRKKIPVRALALFLAILMLVALLPFGVFAAPSDGGARLPAVAIIHTIKVGLNAISATQYASKQEDTSIKGFVDNWIAGFSGNTEPTEEINAIKDCMELQYEATLSTMAEISADISKLLVDVKAINDQLKDNQGYEALKVALDDFYTNFFSSAYGELLKAYQALDTTLSDPYANDATLKVKLDDLYMKSYKMNAIEDYLTGKNQLDGKSIIDLYFEYVQVSDPENANDKAFDFTLKMFEAAIFQKYCMSYASAYQLNYVNDRLSELIGNGEFIGYTVDGTLDGFANKYTLGEIKANINSAKSGIDNVSVAVLKNFVNIYNLNKTVGYTENGCQYYANVSNGSVNVYTDASYQLMSVGDELADMFDLKLYYVGENNGVATYTESGCVNIGGSAGQSFSISYMYGDGTAENGSVVYTLKFNVVDRVFDGGYGIETAPYLIGNKEQLKSFASDASYWNSGVYVKMTADVNMSGDSLGTIGNYYGSFDGDGHTISNLSRSFGWFTNNYGVIKNLNFYGLNVSYSGSGGRTSGGITDVNHGIIRNCSVSSSNVYGYGHTYKNSSQAYSAISVCVGGIAGRNYGNIEYCSVISSNVTSETSSREFFDAGLVIEQDDMTISLYSYSGGIVGSSESGVISGCYVNNSSVRSNIYGAYYRWVFAWEHTYNRVAAYNIYGVIAGASSNTSLYSNTYNGSSSSYGLSRHAHTGSTNKADDSFVTDYSSVGNNGSYTDSTSKPVYASSILVAAMPNRTEYLMDETFNCAGLKIVNDKNEFVYGFTVSSPSTLTMGEKTVKVSLGEMSVEFNVNVNCSHKSFRYDKETPATCKENGYTAGIYCLDCHTYVSGHEVIEKDTSTHYWGSAEVVSKPTCSSKGKNSYTCLICGEVKYETVDELEHTYVLRGKKG